MPTITTENVTPLIASQTSDGRTLTFVFACPVSGTQVTATQLLAPATGGRPQIGGEVKKAALSSLRGPLSSAIRGAFGSSKFGRMLGGIANKSATAAISGSARGEETPTVSLEQRDSAAVAAFTSVAKQFDWSSERGGWVSNEAAAEMLTGLQCQIADGPIQAPYDQGIAARMLIEVASADGELQDEEREVLQLFIDPAVGSVDELAARPALSAAELDEVSAGPVRPTMLAIAWLVALSNDGCDASEAARLDSFANALSLSRDASQATRELAEEFLVDQVLTSELRCGDAAQARASIENLAATIDMSPERLERAEARFHKRRSLCA